MTEAATGGFSALGLDPELLAGVAELGFTTPTEVQLRAAPPLLAGRDLVGRSRTGSGKTLAFGLPLLQRIRRGERRVQALVLCPTRELAAQVTADLRAAGRRSPGLRVVTVVGGEPIQIQTRTLHEGAHVVVGTPGRLCDHLRRGTLDVREARFLVLDEADRMFELGFADEVDAILAALPDDRQTALFSATFPDGVASLAARLRDPIEVVIEAVGTELATSAVLAEEDQKQPILDHLLRALAPASALVFCNLKRVVAETARELVAAGFDAAALHGDLSQTDRDRVLVSFRNGSTRVLVATDVAARGLDIAGLDLVINRDLPLHAEDWTHRVGRTGRAGRSGVAYALVTEAERPRLEGLGTVPVVDLPPLPDDAPPLVSAMATLQVGAGRKDKLRPGDLLGALTGTVGLAGTDVGRIEIHDRWSYVAVAKPSAQAAFHGLVRGGVKGRKVRVDRIGRS